MLAGMNTPHDPATPPLGAPETDQEAELVAAFRKLDSAGRAWLQWVALAVPSVASWPRIPTKSGSCVVSSRVH